MRILITNDDGIHAPGFAALEEIASSLSDDVWAIAPADEQSGAGHSLTLTRPIRLRQLGERRYAVNGTPTDSVMMALAHVMKDRPPDLILSGVNRGANLAEDVTYSGTVSAAMEGALAGIRSIALSQLYPREAMGDSVPFDTSIQWGNRVLRAILDTPPEKGVLLNINFPAIPADMVRGVRVCRQGMRDYGRLQVTERRDPRGYRYYWFGLAPTVETPAHQTDLEAVADGYIAITPLQLDLTHHAGLPGLTQALAKLAE